MCGAIHKVLGSWGRCAREANHTFRGDSSNDCDIGATQPLAHQAVPRGFCHSNDACLYRTGGCLPCGRRPRSSPRRHRVTARGYTIGGTPLPPLSSASEHIQRRDDQILVGGGDGVADLGRDGLLKGHLCMVRLLGAGRSLVIVRLVGGPAARSIWRLSFRKVDRSSIPT